MTAYQKFKKLKIDFSAIEFEQATADDGYFCTPIGARIIGRAGVDGIHYRFVRGQGEIRDGAFLPCSVQTALTASSQRKSSLSVWTGTITPKAVRK